MSDINSIQISSDSQTPNKLAICLFPFAQELTQSLTQLLSGDRYQVNCFNTAQELIDFVRHHQEQIDCLIFVNKNNSLYSVLGQIWDLGILLPVVIVETEPTSETLSPKADKSPESDRAITLVSNHYHGAEVRLYPVQIEQINSYINLAISKFLNLAPNCKLSEKPTKPKQEQLANHRDRLGMQQRRLAEKLKERLDYLGVYYKRNPKDFSRNLSAEEKVTLFQQLMVDYRQIILNYFNDDSETNQLIDKFVNRAFFADLSVAQVLEIHMDLMDEFAQQLKIEGRSEDILLDYRLVLIDIIAHLCEMYRRSIPREELSLELLFKVE
ncbi:MAG: circadian clock protein KaiA [Pleurocapsa sp.]